MQCSINIGHGKRYVLISASVHAVKRCTHLLLHYNAPISDYHPLYSCVVILRFLIVYSAQLSKYVMWNKSTNISEHGAMNPQITQERYPTHGYVIDHDIR